MLEKKQQLEFGDVICIGTIYLLFFENYIAVEAGERNTVSDYLEEVVLENEIKGQEDVRKKEKREITFHRAPRVMEELKKVSSCLYLLSTFNWSYEVDKLKIKHLIKEHKLTKLNPNYYG